MEAARSTRTKSTSITTRRERSRTPTPSSPRQNPPRTLTPNCWHGPSAWLSAGDRASSWAAPGLDHTWDMRDVGVDGGACARALFGAPTVRLTVKLGG